MQARRASRSLCWASRIRLCLRCFYFRSDKGSIPRVSVSSRGLLVNPGSSAWAIDQGRVGKLTANDKAAIWLHRTEQIRGQIDVKGPFRCLLARVRASLAALEAGDGHPDAAQRVDRRRRHRAQRWAACYHVGRRVASTKRTDVTMPFRLMTWKR
jgi:hypothetical protein